MSGTTAQLPGSHLRDSLPKIFLNAAFISQNTPSTNERDAWVVS